MSDVWGEGGRFTRRQLVFDFVVAGGFGLLTIPLHAMQSVGAATAAAILALGLAARRAALPVMVVLGVGAGLVQLVSTDIAMVADLAYAVLAFRLGAHHDRWWRLFGLAAATVAAICAGIWGGLVTPGAGDYREGFSATAAVGLAAVTAVVTLGGWVAGYLRLQSRRAVQARVDARLDAAERRRLTDAFDQEQERRRIAADMHDVVAHSWAVVGAQADGARYALRASPEDAERALAVIGETARVAIGDVRTILAELRYRADVETMSGHEEQAALLRRMTASGLRLDFAERGTRSDSRLLGLTAHRLLSESLTNALKHGELAEPVVVRQDWTDGYRLTVTNTPDDGHPRAVGTGHGIIGMTERARVAGGHLASRRVGDLWQVEAHIPSTATGGAS